MPSAMPSVVALVLAAASVAVARGGGSRRVTSLAERGDARPGVVGPGVVGPGDVGHRLVRLVRLVRLRGLDPRRSTVRDEHLAAALEAVASSLRSGATVPRAVTEAAGGPGAAVGFGSLGAHLERGVPFDEAVSEWSAAVGASGAGLVAAVLGLAVDLGGRAAEAVDGVVATLRARAAVAGEAHALAAQATASVGVLVVAPLVFAVLSATVDARVAAFFVSPAGAGCVGVAVLLDLAGAWWMVGLTRRVTG